MLAAAEAAAGQIDILVNNADDPDGLSMRMKDEDFGAVLDVNLTATFRLCRGAMKGMMKRRWGRIINVVSVVGFMGNPGQANYAASKAGIVGMTKSMAKELGSRGITANCVAPGYVETAMTADLPEKVVSEQIAMVPAGRMGRPKRSPRRGFPRQRRSRVHERRDLARQRRHGHVVVCPQSDRRQL